MQQKEGAAKGFSDLGGVKAAERKKQPLVQPVDFTTLAATAAEIQALLPLRVSGARQASATEITLCLGEEGSGAERYLRLCWNRKLAHVCLVDGSEAPADDTASRSLSTTSEDLLQGLHLVRAQVLGFSRVLRLDFSDRSRTAVDPPPLGGVVREQGGEGEGGAGRTVPDDSEEEDPDEVEPFGMAEDVFEQDDAPPPVDQDEPPEVTGHVYFEGAGQSGNARLVLVGNDNRVVTAAPPVDRAGNVWQRIGRRYLEPGVSTRRSGGEDDETSEAPPETEADHQRAEPTLLENQEEWVARVQSALAPTGEPAGSIRQALLQAYQGLSPALVQQMVSAAGIPGSEPLGSLSAADWASLSRIWKGWLWALADGNFDAVIEGDGMRYAVVPWPSPPADLLGSTENSAENEDDEKSGGEAPPGAGGAEGQRFDSVSACVSAYYQALAFSEAHGRLCQEVEGAMGGQRAKIASFKKRIEEAKMAENLKIHGEALLVNKHLVKPGASHVSLPDYASLKEGDDEVPMMEFDIDPMLSAADNAALFFKRFKKLVRQDTASERLLVEATKALTDLIQAQGALSNVPRADGPARALAALRTMEESLVARGLVKRRADDDAEQAQEKARAVGLEKARSSGKRKIKVRGRGKVPEFLRFKTPSGLEVVAGKSSRQNDRVTWGLARDHHLWFHARGIGGSHVVLLLPKGSDKGVAGGKAKKEDIIFAARVAAFYSKARADTRVDVSYTERRHLRQPPQRLRKPGMVMITREEVVTVAPSDCADYRID